MLGAVIGISRLHIRATTSCENFGVAKLWKQCVSGELSQWRTALYKVETRNYGNWRVFVPKKWSNTKQTYGQVCRPILYTRPGILQYCTKTVQPTDALNVNTGKTVYPMNPLNVNARVKNNVMLYRFERPYLFKCATVFAVMAFVGCITMVDVVYKVLCRGLWNPEKSLKTRLLEHLIPLTAILTGLVGGPAIAFFVCFLTLRSVKYIILRKGGKEVTIVTYHPIKSEVVRTVPLESMSSLTTRDGLKAYIPIKIKGIRWNFMCDKNGNFVNADLFDNTVGIRRFE